MSVVQAVDSVRTETGLPLNAVIRIFRIVRYNQFIFAAAEIGPHALVINYLFRKATRKNGLIYTYKRH